MSLLLTLILIADFIQCLAVSIVNFEQVSIAGFLGVIPYKHTQEPSCLSSYQPFTELLENIDDNIPLYKRDVEHFSCYLLIVVGRRRKKVAQVYQQ